MTPEDVRLLARSAPERWSELELVHRSNEVDVRATLRHGELEATRLYDGRRIHEIGAPASSWSVRPLEPYATNYEWSAMLDPYELGHGVAISDVRVEELYDRPVVAFVARAEPGYDPVCSCCPLVFSEVSQRLELGDDWRPEPIWRSPGRPRQPPKPRKTRSRLSTSTIVVESSLPTTVCALLRRTVVILSTMTKLSWSSPFDWSAATGTRRRGASTPVLVNGQTVNESVAWNRSSCTTRAGRGLFA